MMDNLPAEERARSGYNLLFQHPLPPAGEGPARVNLHLLSEPEIGGFLPSVILMASVAAQGTQLHGEVADKLRQLASTRGSEPCKLHDWSAPVTLEWPLRLALTRMGDTAAKRDLLASIHDAGTAERIFLLDCIHLVDDPPALHQIAAACLHDLREILHGVPFGAAPKRRLADYAVDQLVKRLKLPVAFRPGIGSRYSESQLQETAALLRQSIPS